jgi:hypothetical protein
MDQKKLHALLADVDRELKAAGSLDARSQELLQQVLADIPRAQPAAGNHDETIESRLRDLVLHFEAEHPKLSGVVAQVADALGKLGI